MKYFFIAVLYTLMLALSSCSKENNKADAFKKIHALSGDTSTPACMLHKIDSIYSAPPMMPPVKIYSYTYNLQKVYYIQNGCCDFFNELYDDNCNLLCYPDGGLTGGGDGRCRDFHNTKTNEQLVWEDPR